MISESINWRFVVRFRPSFCRMVLLTVFDEQQIQSAFLSINIYPVFYALVYSGFMLETREH